MGRRRPLRPFFLFGHMTSRFLTLCGLLLAVSLHPAILKAQVFQFGKVGLDADIEHTFRFQNEGSEPLEIKEVQLTPPLVVTKMTGRVEPGATGSVTVRLEKPHKKGEFEGAVVVYFKADARKPLAFQVEGQIVPPVDFIPFAQFFVSTERGAPKTASIEVVNHAPEPFEIRQVQHGSGRFTTELQTLEPGRRYRLSLTLNGDGPAGNSTDLITLRTSSREHPYLEVKASTIIRERVYAFPDAVQFGQISTDYLKARPQMVGFLAQTIMVYQAGGKGFQISAETDVPFLRLYTHQANFKDRYAIQVAVVPEKLKSGEVNGSIVITTNDPQFPRLVLPVTGVIEGNW